MPWYVIAAATLAALSLPVLVYTVAGDWVPRGRVARNLATGLAPGADLRTLVLNRSWTNRIVRPLLGALSRPARRLSPQGLVAALDRSVQISGIGWSVERLLVVKLALGAGLLAAGLAWALLDVSGPRLLAAACLGVIGYLGPDVVVVRRARDRQARIANELADTLDQLTICVEAGLGFDAALARSAKAGRGPLAVEIGRMLQEFRVGVPRADAMANLLARTDVAELRQFVHAVIQAETYGVPITRMLRAQAADQRERRRYRAEERAMKLPVKVIFPLVFCIVPTLFILIVGPAFIRLAGGLT